MPIPPPPSQALIGQARALDRAGRWPEAIALYEQILARWPDLPDCWYHLAFLQRRTRRFPAALASYAQALERGVRRPEEVHLNRGVIYADDLRDEQAAERELAAALSLNPTYVPALLNLANLHEDLGRRDAAAAAYERILAITPGDAQALARLAGLHTFGSADDPLIDRLRRALADPEAGAADRASLGFALGRALDACTDYDGAFNAYAEANRCSRASAAPGTAHYDRQAQERLVERVMVAFPAQAQMRGPAASQASPQQRPLFVCGMFRSGSTLIERILGGHPRVATAGELDFVPHAAQQLLSPFPEGSAAASPAQLATVAAQYRALLASLAPGAGFVTDKRPDNHLYIGLIKRLFPDARIVYTSRDAVDNCLSIFFLHLDQRMSYALDLMDTAHYYRQHLRLMAHWKGLFGADIIEVNYDALVRAPEAVARPLFEQLGLDWPEGCLSLPPARAVKTASVWQVREPVYLTSSGRARHYAPRLEGLRRYLDAQEPLLAAAAGPAVASAPP